MEPPNKTSCLAKQKAQSSVFIYIQDPAIWFVWRYGLWFPYLHVFEDAAVSGVLIKGALLSDSPICYCMDKFTVRGCRLTQEP